MAIQLRRSQIKSGYISVKKAAASTDYTAAFLRRHVTLGNLLHIRDERNRIYIKETSLADFIKSPPVRAKRAPSADGKTRYQYIPASVRALRGSIRQVRALVDNGPERDTCLEVLEAVLEYQTEKQAAKDAAGDESN